MKLSKRLQHIANMVTKGSRVADIGTDHGLLPIALVEEGIAPSAIAMDLRKGPLGRAMEHIALHGMKDRILTRLSDGMQNLHSDEVDSIVIAGLGGELMIRILDARQDLWDKEFILSPHSEWKLVRRYLREHGMAVVDEDMVLDERNKYYIILKVRKACTADKEQNMESETGSDAKYNAIYDDFGKLLIQRKHPVLTGYLQKEEAQYRKILAKLQETNAGGVKAVREQEITEYLCRIEDVLRKMR